MFKTFEQYVTESTMQPIKIVVALEDGSDALVPYGVFEITETHATIAPVNPDGSRMKGAAGKPQTHPIDKTDGRNQVKPYKAIIIDLDHEFVVKETAENLKPNAKLHQDINPMKAQNTVPYSTATSKIAPVKGKSPQKNIDVTAGAQNPFSKTPPPVDDGKEYHKSVK